MASYLSKRVSDVYNKWERADTYRVIGAALCATGIVTNQPFLNAFAIPFLHEYKIKDKRKINNNSENTILEFNENRISIATDTFGYMIVRGSMSVWWNGYHR